MSKYEYDEYGEYDPENDMNDPEYERRQTGFYQTNEFEEADMFNRLTPAEQEATIKDFKKYAEQVKAGNYGIEDDIAEIAQDLFEKGYTPNDTAEIMFQAKNIAVYFREKFGNEIAEKVTKTAFLGIQKELENKQKVR